MKKLTDLEMFIKTYKQFGIDIITYEEDGKILINLNGWADDKESTHSEKLNGYAGFSSTLEFTLFGKFITQGFWE